MSLRLKNLLLANRWLLLILILAIGIRVLYLNSYAGLPDWDQLTVDNYYHHHWAQAIARGDVLGDTTYFRAPFYVFCLGLLYAILGSSLWVGRLFGLAIGVGSIIMTYLLGKRVLGARVGLIAALLQSLYPMMIYFESELLLDPLFTLLLQLAIYQVLTWFDRKQLKQVLITGVLFGLAAITRPTALVFIPVVILLIILTLKQARTRTKQSIAFILGALMVIAPISVRNLAVAEDPVLVSSQGGINLYIGNNGSADGISAVLPEPLGHNWQIRDISFLAQQEEGRRLKPGQVSSFWARKAIDWIIAHPVEFAGLYLKKLYFSISNRKISNNRDLGVFFRDIPILKYNPLTFGILFAFAAVGIAVGFRRHLFIRLLVLFVISYLLAVALFFFNSRFRLPLLPYFFVLSSYGLVSTVQIMRNRQRSIIRLLLIAVAAGLFSFYPVVSFPVGASPIPIISKGLHYFEKGDYQRAGQYYRKALAVDSSFPEANLNLGACYLRLGMADSARFYFEREKMLNPKRVKGYVNMASLYLVKGQYDSAFNEVQQALACRPYDVTANRILLRSAFSGQQFDNDSLVKLAWQAAERTGDDIYVLNEAAALVAERGALPAAESLLLRGVNAQPPPIETDDEAFSPSFRNSLSNWARQRAQTYYQLGYLNGLQGNYPEAIRYSSLAIRNDSDLVEAYVNLISGFVSSGQPEQAKAILDSALQRFPANIHLNRMREQFGR